MLHLTDAIFFCSPGLLIRFYCHKQRQFALDIHELGLFLCLRKHLIKIKGQVDKILSRNEYF